MNARGAVSKKEADGKENSKGYTQVAGPEFSLVAFPFPYYLLANAPFTPRRSACTQACASGKRACAAIESLASEYPNLANVEGGFAAW